MDGTNLLPYITANRAAKSPDSPPHDKLFWRGGHYQVVISEGYKLQRTARPDKAWLFNLNDDPTEQNNIAAEQPDLVARLSNMLDDHNREQMDPAWPALIESPQFIDKTGRDETGPLDEHIYWPN